MAASVTATLLIRATSSTPGGPFSVEGQPPLATWEYNGGLGLFYAAVNALPIGGVSPYSYLWSITFATDPDTAFIADGTQYTALTSPLGGTATIQCEVTDSLGNVAVSNTITVSL